MTDLTQPSKSYVQMIVAAGEETLFGTMDVRMFANHCHMAALRLIELLNETELEGSKKK